MNAFLLRIQQAKENFQNGDISLAERQLIDSVLDSNDLNLFRSMLQSLDQKDSLGDWNEDLFYKMTQALIDFVPQMKAFEPSATLMQVKGIGKRYSNSGFRIAPLSFDVHYGQVVGLVGENGNGKTTLLRLLCKDLKPDIGSISYAAEARCRSNFELRSQLVYMPQRVPRWFGSLMDNLYFTLSSHGIKGEFNAMMAELMVARLGLRPFRNHKWTEISSGYRTRFELAKSLLRQPQLMLLDEPLSNLDIISQQTILQDLKSLSMSLRRPFGLVLSSQQLYEVEKISDLVIFLKQGEAQYQNKIQEGTESKDLMIEIEGPFEREQLQLCLANCQLKEMQFNGGVYVLTFDASTPIFDVYKAIAEHQLPVLYFRNITHSSRRFFI
jgi:ABC-2 type transport system ATP-binding protein